MRGVSLSPETEAGRLLRVLLVRNGEMPARAAEGQLLRIRALTGHPGSFRISEREPRVSIGRVLLLTALAMCWHAKAFGEALYFVDAHSQVDHNIALESVVSLMKEAGVKTTILAARGKREPREIANLAEKYPGRVVAAVRTKGKPYQRNSSDYYRELSEQLDSGRFGAMAEVLLYHARKGGKADKVMVFPDDERVAAAFEGARKRGWPFVLHIEFASLGGGKRKQYWAALKRFLARHSDHPVVLIHMGQLDASRVEKLIDACPNVYFLTSHSNPVATGRSGQPWVNMFSNGVLAPEWEALLVARRERFIFALDNVWAEQWRKGYREQVLLWRQALDELPPDVAAAVAHGNAESLWNLGPTHQAAGRTVSGER
jgi:predicted TIM-barrel fold metal-dependent hydrolase